MSAMGIGYQVEQIKELADGIMDAALNDDILGIRWRVDQMQEHVNHIRERAEEGKP